MKRTQPKINNPYTLTYRARTKDGQWGKWITGTGEWIGLVHVQNQIKMLKLNRKGSDMEFLLEYSGKYLNAKGEEIEGTFKLESR